MDKSITSLAGRMAPTRASSAPKANVTVTFAERLKEYSDKTTPAEGQKTPFKSVMLVGEISGSRQTVSELLMHNRYLKESTWNIISAEQNQNKDFTQLTPGTKVYYNSEDNSLSWSGASQPPASPAQPSFFQAVAMVEKNAPDPAPAAGLPLGVIDERTPTVSHLLKAFPSLKDNTWNILSSDVNSRKDFSNLPVGTAVSIDPVSHEISWQSSRPTATVAAAGTELAEVEVPAASATVSAANQAAAVPENENQPILLGRIDAGNPTVSHLLHEHQEFGRQTWAVLGNDLNRNKPFAEIRSGTEIYLQPGSLEIVWDKMVESSPAATRTTTASPEPAQAPADTGGRAVRGSDPAADLTEAVQPFLGTPYKELNCYELLVKGLERMHIPYAGKGGLFSKLTRMAHEKGLPANAYLNGEGIVKAAGSLVLSKSFSRPTNWKRAAEQLYKEMEPLLDKGQILSFSTQSRGHTGIISQQQDQWTFINSGRLDHSLTSKSPANGVGEEVLQQEIGNWFKLANASHEPLTVTLGALGQERVVTAMTVPDNGTSGPRRI